MCQVRRLGRSRVLAGVIALVVLLTFSGASVPPPAVAEGPVRKALLFDASPRSGYFAETARILLHLLAKDYIVRTSGGIGRVEPMKGRNLEGVDVLVLPWSSRPPPPREVGPAWTLSQQEIGLIQEWVSGGGSLLVVVGEIGDLDVHFLNTFVLGPFGLGLDRGEKGEAKALARLEGQEYELVLFDYRPLSHQGTDLISVGDQPVGAYLRYGQGKVAVVASTSIFESQTVLGFRRGASILLGDNLLFLLDLFAFLIGDAPRQDAAGLALRTNLELLEYQVAMGGPFVPIGEALLALRLPAYGSPERVREMRQSLLRAQGYGRGQAYDELQQVSPATAEERETVERARETLVRARELLALAQAALDRGDYAAARRLYYQTVQEGRWAFAVTEPLHKRYGDLMDKAISAKETAKFLRSVAPWGVAALLAVALGLVLFTGVYLRRRVSRKGG